MPTAEEFRKLNTSTAFINSNKEAEYCMKQFAKLHVEAALKQGSEKATAGNEDCYYSSLIDKESILNAYPLDNIK